jgi:alginate O-acetyltransferase complex protein AlgI
MLLPEILLLAGLALLFRAASTFGTASGGLLSTRPAVRGWLIFVASVIALYWLQPSMPVRNMDFWLPTATLALTVFSWLVTAPAEARFTRANALAGGLLVGLVLLVALTRYIGGGDWLTATRPPLIETVLAGLALIVLLAVGITFALRSRAATGYTLGAAIVLLIVLLVLLKTPALALETGRSLRGLIGQNPALATALDIRWLGISYICFRLIHTLRDRQTGRLPAVDLKTYVSYIIFFPAVIAGPIDRLERFARDFRTVHAVQPAAETQPSPRPAAALGIVAQPAVRFAPVFDEALTADLTEAGRRLALGMFKKFALADSLALIALSPTNALQVREPGWLWLILYLYAFQIFLDFSGYTDIAIGLGRILGIKLPENFNAPYLKPNLTQFWNAWHMTLTQWFRAYFFNPFVRWLRIPQRRVSPSAVLLLSQVSTMLLIGLWHGITLNFVLWGLWHGLGLFAQNRWTEGTRGWFAAREFSPPVQNGLRVISTLITFHYVALGWVWFVLPAPQTAWTVLLRLFGGGY